MSGQGNRVVYGLTGWSGRVSRVVPVTQPRRANNRLAVIRRLPMAAADNAHGVIRPTTVLRADKRPRTARLSPPPGE
ncbi:hypothetical protein APB60_30365 [Pseudomonas aeruginosa]|nr:hypothetical protein APB60_30365 [Pseudomonas aeruginosa]RPU68230.1 hypothetical protein IPC884_11195 [Pseudomonas aeruginosa]